MKNSDNSNAKLVQNDTFLSRTFNSAVIPSILTTLTGTITIIVDGILVGQKIGLNGLAALNYCLPLYMIQCVIGSLIVSGAGIISSRLIGNSDHKGANDYCQVAVTLGIIVSVLLTFFGVLFLDPISKALCSDPEITPMIVEYAYITFLGTVSRVLLYIPFWYLRIEGKNNHVLISVAIMAVGNIILDIVFLFGLGYGVAGAALASVISTTVATMYGLIILFSKKTRVNFEFNLKMPTLAMMKKIFVTGSPAANNNLMQTLRLLVVNYLLTYFGGTDMVAYFTVINGVASVSESITVGVPSAGIAITGICYGEHDNPSLRIILKKEIIYGILLCLVFGAAIIFGSDYIAMAYGVDGSIRFPMMCLAASLVPALLCGILIHLYNVTGHEVLSNTMITLRIFVFAAITTFLLQYNDMAPWPFLFQEQVLTLFFWIIASGFIARRRKLSRFLLLDTELEHSGNVINFSSDSSAEQIAGASEKIVTFCENNDMNPKEVMSVSLALEEIMALIAEVNRDHAQEKRNNEKNTVPGDLSNNSDLVLFDIRVFKIQGVIGIRFRYDGIPFNPVAEENQSDMYMGIRLVTKITQTIVYRVVFGMNSLSITI
jgi:Na+-driven multidrug efflux pump